MYKVGQRVFVEKIDCDGNSSKLKGIIAFIKKEDNEKLYVINIPYGNVSYEKLCSEDKIKEGTWEEPKCTVGQKVLVDVSCYGIQEKEKGFICVANYIVEPCEYEVCVVTKNSFNYKWLSEKVLTPYEWDEV